jgi:hypothetical protein
MVATLFTSRFNTRMSTSYAKSIYTWVYVAQNTTHADPTTNILEVNEGGNLPTYQNHRSILHIL